MTKFLSYYHLKSIYDTKEFVGVAEDSDEANIIATTGRNVVNITNIASQKELCCWTVLDKLSTKVVYDRASNKYVGVFGNAFLRIWSLETKDLNKVKKMKFKRKILDLISHGNEVLVLYMNGTIEPLSSAIENRKLHDEKESNFPQNVEVLQTNIFDLYNDYKLLTYFIKTGQEVELITNLLDPELRPISDLVKYNLIRHDSSITLSGYTIVEGDIAPILITIWSDKRIFMLKLEEKPLPQEAPGNFVSMLDFLNTTKPISIAGITKHCVVIYGANTNQEEGGSLILFNTQYKVVKAKQYFKIYFDFSRIWVIKNYILLAIGQNVSVVTFNICKELLSDMIGSQFTNDNQNTAIDELINEVNEELRLEEKIFYPKNTEILRRKISKTKKDDEYQIEAKIADGRTISYQPFDIFDSNYRNLCSQNMHVEIFSENEHCEETYYINLMGNSNAETFSRIEFDIIAQNLKKNGASEQEISEKLIILALKTNLFEEIAICLRNYSNIYERVLVMVIKYSLQGITIDNIKEVQNQEDVKIDENKILKNIKDYPIPKESFPNVDLCLHKYPLISVSKPFDLLNIALSCTFDTNTMSYYVRDTLSMEEVIILIQHLYNLIISNKVCLEERPDTSIDFDEDQKILEWFSLILSTHFQKISFSVDITLIELLAQWNNFLLIYKNNLLELQKVAAMLYNIIDKKKFVRVSSQWYSIESTKLF